MTSKTETAVNQVLIVDDHPVMRGGLASLLDPEEGIEVIGEAGTVSDALALIEKRIPDLVLVDLRLPDGNGLELIKGALARWPDLLFLVVTMHDEKIYAERVLRAGGRGFVMKEVASERLLQAVRRVLEGEIYVSEGMMRTFLGEKTLQRRSPEAQSPMRILTDRELEIFELIGLGKGTRRIAEQLTIGVKTVETHYANIKSKLNIADRNELTSFAARWTAEKL